MKEINRRTFLRWGATLATGVAVGEFMIPVKVRLNEVVEQATGHPSGNASLRQEIEEACKDSDLDNVQNCVQNYQFPTADKVMDIVVEPIGGELLFRGLPSGMVSEMEDRDDPIIDVLSGTGRLGMTRRELLVGVATSIIFRAIHNITDKGIDTKTIPASQTVGGMVYWYLQRKLGIAANILAHVWNNFRALT